MNRGEEGGKKNSDCLRRQTSVKVWGRNREREEGHKERERERSVDRDS